MLRVQRVARQRITQHLCGGRRGVLPLPYLCHIIRVGGALTTIQPQLHGALRDEFAGNRANEQVREFAQRLRQALQVRLSNSQRL